ncbi:MAG: response regulator [Spirochaetales bacterium]
MERFGRHYQIIFEHSPIGIMILDFQGRIILTNEAVHRMFHRSAAELRGVTLASLCTEGELEGFFSQFPSLLERLSKDAEYECKVRMGEEGRWVKVRLHYVGQGDFSPFVFALLEDITQHKRGEERLLREKEEAEKATQIKSAFLANMSHEIRTPIHTITGMTELLLETRLDEEQKEYAYQVRYAAEVLLGLINDILDFSKIEAGKLSLEIIPCDLVSLIEEAVDMVSLLAHKKGLEIIVDTAKEVPRWVWGDPVRIKQILINLINNAVKFTQKGEVLVRTRVKEKDRSVQTLPVEFEVIDTGIGIPEDKISLLFDAFTQVDSSTTRKFGGTGLGLSISKSLVQMMNGSIGVRSIYGKGSTFYFTLPLNRVPEHEEEPEMVIEEPESLYPVLIVEDNSHVWEVLYYHLTDWFKKVDWAKNGQEALHMLVTAEESPYQLVLVDQHLPGMDGWQLASEIRNAPLTLYPKLILMSPLGFGTEAKMKLLGWFSGYLDKPIKRKKLLECLNSLLYGTEIEEAKAEVTETSGLPKRWSRVKVLVAEDHLVNQQLFKTILEKYGVEVVLAENGLEAVSMVEKEQVDLVFMDVQMPVMNGYEAALRLRDKGYQGPIVAVTANAVRGEREKCLASGMDDYLTKPFKSKDLLPFLEKYLPKQAIEKDLEIGEIEELEEELPAPSSSSLSSSTPTRPSSLSGQTNTTREPEIFNYEEALDTFMGKTEVLKRVLQSFQEKVLKQIPEMRQYLEQEQWDSLTVVSHGIKGGAWNLQARRLGDIAFTLEQASKQKNKDLAKQALQQLEQEFRVFENFLAQREAAENINEKQR